MKNLIVWWLLWLSWAISWQSDSLLLENNYSKIDTNETKCIMKYWKILDDNEEWAVKYQNTKESLIVEYIESEVWKELVLVLQNEKWNLYTYTFNDWWKVEVQTETERIVDNTKYAEACAKFCNKLQDILWVKRF